MAAHYDSPRGIDLIAHWPNNMAMDFYPGIIDNKYKWG